MAGAPLIPKSEEKTGRREISPIQAASLQEGDARLDARIQSAAAYRTAAVSAPFTICGCLMCDPRTLNWAGETMRVMPLGKSIVWKRTVTLCQMDALVTWKCRTLSSAFSNEVTHFMLSL